MGWLKILTKLGDKVLSKDDKDKTKNLPEDKTKNLSEDKTNETQINNLESSKTEETPTGSIPNLEEYLPVDSSSLDESTIELFRYRLLQDKLNRIQNEVDDSVELAEDNEGSEYDKLYNTLSALVGLETADNELLVDKDSADLAADKLEEKLSKERYDDLAAAIRRYNRDLDDASKLKLEEQEKLDEGFNNLKEGLSNTEVEEEKSDKDKDSEEGFKLPSWIPGSNILSKLVKPKWLTKGFKFMKWFKPYAGPAAAIGALLVAYKGAFDESKKLDAEVPGLMSADVLEGAIKSGGNIPLAAYDPNRVREDKEILAQTIKTKEDEIATYGKEVPQWVKNTHANWYEEENETYIKSKEDELNINKPWYKLRAKYPYWNDAAYEVSKSEFIDWFMKEYDTNIKKKKKVIVSEWNEARKFKQEKEKEKSKSVNITNLDDFNLMEPNGITATYDDMKMSTAESGKGEGKDPSGVTGTRSSVSTSGTNLARSVTFNTINNINSNNSEVLIENRDFRISYI